jgi:hypothetical protein
MTAEHAAVVVVVAVIEAVAVDVVVEVIVAAAVAAGRIQSLIMGDRLVEVFLERSNNNVSWSVYNPIRCDYSVCINCAGTVPD